MPEAGDYYLWGRIQAPTPDDDPFFGRACTEDAKPVSRIDWHTGQRESCEWTAFS
ncbi:MAG: hypothetical protein GF393_11875 [Armatimonadia bacterium]|nr:hypothetical protein [Armatimonadia bacterium]